MSRRGVGAIAGGTLVAAAVFSTAAAFAVVGTGEARSTYEGSSAWLRAAGIGAVVALEIAAVLLVAGPATRSAGAASACLGIAWLAPLVVGWQDGPARLRTAAQIVAPLAPALTAALVVALPLRSGRAALRLRRTAVAAAAAAALALSVALAVARDPLRDLRCWSDCTIPPVLADRSFGLVTRLTHGLVGASLALSLLACVLAVGLLARSSAVELRTYGPALVAATAAGLWQAARAAELLIGPPESPTRLRYEWLFAAQSCSLVLLAAALAWCVVRPRLVRSRVTRLALDLERTSEPGGLASVLAATLGDDRLHVLFPVDGGLVDADGVSQEPTVQLGDVTPLVGSAGVVAYVDSRREGFESAGRTLGPAAELALGNDRLRAETLARLRQVTASRARLVEAAEGARRRMERDLHDGAQQRMLALGYDLLVAISQAEERGDGERAATLRIAHARSVEAARELREIAGGLYPPALQQYGLAAALDSLADTEPLSLSLSLPRNRRYAARIEAAAYAVVAEAASQVPTLRVRLEERPGRLHLSLDGWNGRPPTWFEDRAGAVGGSVTTLGSTLEISFPLEG